MVLEKKIMIQGIVWYHLTERNSLCKPKVSFSNKSFEDISKGHSNVVSSPFIADRLVSFYSAKRCDSVNLLFLYAQHTLLHVFPTLSWWNARFSMHSILIRGRRGSNHLVCGSLKQFIKEITIQHLSGSSSLLLYWQVLDDLWHPRLPSSSAVRGHSWCSFRYTGSNTAKAT